MKLTDLAMALREKKKWEEAGAELSRRLRAVETEIENATARLRELELELSRMMEMLHAEPRGNLDTHITKLREEVK
ncbi:MAG: hypothetical protein QW115_03675 [Thermoplasmata archaeon]